MNRLFYRRLSLGLVAVLSLSLQLIYAQPPRRSFEESERYHGAEEKAIVPTGPVYLIKISSQIELSQLNDKVRKAIKDGRKNIVVDISQGTYYYDRLPVYLYNIDAPDVCLSIKGNSAIMIAGGKDYPSAISIKTPNRYYSYLDQAGKSIDLFGDVFQLKSQVEVVNVSSKLCRIPLQEPASYTSGMLIQLSEWYQSAVYSVKRIQGGYLYFVADNLKYDNTRKCYNVNYDYGVSSLYPRYRLWDPSKIKRVNGRIHECTVNYFLCLYRVKLKSFSLSDLSFNGSAKGEKNALLYFREVDAEQITMEDCSFENMNHRIVQLADTDNFLFKNNTIKNCMFEGIYSSTDCENTIVTGNTFYRLGKAWTNTSAVSCYGKNFSIANNTFEDVSYCSINVGAHVNWTHKKVTSGVIEHNEIWFGEEYFRNGYKYNLIDGGAVYIATMNEKVIVRYNYIHNYSGINSNRAVYFDEGAMNVRIYGNVIRDIPHGHALFSWRSTRVNSIIPESNDGIDFFYNVIWGRYKFDEKENSSCIKGKNLLLYDEKLPETTIINFAYQEDDILSKGASVKDGIIALPGSALKELQKFPTYEGVKKWIR